MNVGRDIVTRAYDRESFDTLLEDLVKEIELRNYRVTRINHIDNVLAQTEREVRYPVRFERYKIVEFCNLSSCAELISLDLLAGVFMPVRFAVYRRSEDTRAFVSFLRPTAFARPFGSPALGRVAAELEEDMNYVLEELDF